MTQRYAKNYDRVNPVVLAADLHLEIVHIHPFKDFNGRTARLAMNLHLMQHGYPPLAIMPTEKPRYFEALEKGHFNDSLPFREFIAELELHELERYVHALEVAYEIPRNQSLREMDMDARDLPGR